MNDFTKLKNPVVQLKRVLSFVTNIFTEEKYIKTDNRAKPFHLLIIVSLDKRNINNRHVRSHQ